MILVTGGAGYVGSHFVKAYLEHDRQTNIVVIDNLSRGHKEALPKSNRVIFILCEIGDKEAVGKIFSTYAIDSVVHFAAKAYVHESQLDPFGYFRSNVLASIALFELMEKHQVRKIVFSSSCALYGVPNYLPLDEEHPLKPTNVYGLTKLMIEQTLSSLSETLGWRSISLRYFNAAGASDAGEIGESHDPETHLIPNLLKAAKGTTASVMIYGTDYQTKDGTCIRDYVHVSDLASGHVRALAFLTTMKDPEALAFNLGTSIGSSVLEVIEVCEKVSGRKISQQTMPRRFGDSPVLVADASRAKRVLGWKPNYSLKYSVETAWNWELNRQS